MTMVQIADEGDGGKIAKLIRLLASDRDGEVLAAVRALGRALRSAGRDFNDLAAMLTNSAPGFEPEPDWRIAARQCLEHRHRLKARDVDFLQGLLVFDEPTSKQLKWLDDCLRRIRT